MQDGSRNALVLFSGGQDSTVCLAWALANFQTVETVGFFYGQRHAAEMAVRPRILDAFREHFPQWSPRLGQDIVLPLDVLKEIGGSALTEDSEIALSATGLPTTFVPGRNILFLTCAAALAYRRGIADLVGGMCETDYSGYPDCRDATIRSAGQTLSLAMDKAFTIHTPLMGMDKAATWRLAEDLAGDALVNLIVEETVTCYRGDREHRHDWGYGCGDCPACELRAKGWEKYRAT